MEGILSVDVTIASGGTFSYHFENCKRLAQMLDCRVSYDFSGLKINITKHSTAEYTWENYRKAIESDQIVLSAFGEGW